MDDVEEFPGHIACDAGARSELVVPVVAKGELRAVLDLDSYSVGAFSRREGEALLALLRAVFDGGAVAW